MNKQLIILLISLLPIIGGIVYYIKYIKKDNQKLVEQFKLTNEACNEFAKDRCFYLKNTSEWYDCIQDSLTFC